MTPLAKTLIRAQMALLLGISAALARRPRLWRVSRAWSRNLAALAVRTRGVRRAADAAELGQQWQRSFPSPKQVPVDRVADGMAYARITTPCPLRGSGDTHACWRMMEYDRAVARAAGGDFVVLASQAEPGRAYCEVALTMPERGAALVAAHQRAPGGRATPIS